MLKSEHELCADFLRSICNRAYLCGAAEFEKPHVSEPQNFQDISHHLFSYMETILLSLIVNYYGRSYGLIISVFKWKSSILKPRHIEPRTTKIGIRKTIGGQNLDRQPKTPQQSWKLQDNTTAQVHAVQSVIKVHFTNKNMNFNGARMQT